MPETLALGGLHALQHFMRYFMSRLQVLIFTRLSIWLTCRVCAKSLISLEKPQRLA